MGQRTRGGSASSSEISFQLASTSSQRQVRVDRAPHLVEHEFEVTPKRLSLSFLPSLQEFHYGDTDLCVPAEERFRAWIGAIASHEGTAVDCPLPSDRDLLVALYDATGGPDWPVSESWLTDRPLEEWHGVEVDGNGRVTGLGLSYNNLTGPIPPELVSLTNLSFLDLNGNELTGPVPTELGGLSNLEFVSLLGNELTGAIPAELGSLADLTRLNLGNNDLNGSIPPALGGLANLESLWLEGNVLAGSVPPELGGLTNLKDLRLQDNELKGTLPPEFGGLENLASVVLARNGRLAGALPARLTDLGRLEEFLAADTNLCAPSDAGFLDWLSGVPKTPGRQLRRRSASGGVPDSGRAVARPPGPAGGGRRSPAPECSWSPAERAGQNSLRCGPPSIGMGRGRTWWTFQGSRSRYRRRSGRSI